MGFVQYATDIPIIARVQACLPDKVRFTCIRQVDPDPENPVPEGYVCFLSDIEVQDGREPHGFRIRSRVTQEFTDKLLQGDDAVVTTLVVNLVESILQALKERGLS